MNDSSTPVLLVDVWIVPGKKALSMVKGGGEHFAAGMVSKLQPFD